VKGLACLCFGLGADVLLELEQNVGGLHSSNADLEINGMTYNRVMGYFVLDFILYVLAALYLAEVLPSEWGTQRRWNFVCTPAFWQGRTADKRAGSAGVGEEELSPRARARVAKGLGASVGVLAAGRDPSKFQSTPMADADAGVQIRRLRKEFTVAGSTQVAVNDLTVDMRAGEVFALLGHNGAGKTTMSMLTHAASDGRRRVSVRPLHLR